MQEPTKLETEHSNTTPKVAVSSTATEARLHLLKDFSTPLSIVIAGMFIGAGLYFGGTPTIGTDAKPTSGNPLLDLAITAGADKKDFSACLENKETLSLVQEDAANAVSTGGKGTPWAIIVSQSGKKYPINGALPQAAIEQLIAVAMANGEAPLAEGITIEALDTMTPVNESDHIKGNRDAKVVIVEYSDFDCPFCTRFHATMNAIVKKYPPTEVAWVYRHFPLEQLHPEAETVAVAAECVAKLEGNEGFWKFADDYLK
jgi:protein-disulfide isomerase